MHERATSAYLGTMSCHLARADPLQPLSSMPRLNLARASQLQRDLGVLGRMLKPCSQSASPITQPTPERGVSAVLLHLQPGRGGRHEAFK